MGCSQAVVSTAIKTEQRIDVVPLAKQEEARKIVVRRPGSKKKSKANRTPVQALVVYADACLKQTQAYKDCLSAGITESALQAFGRAMVSADKSDKV